MSFRYRKVVPGGFFFKTYGFQRVTPEEMQQIVQRLQKQTYSREFAHNECFQPGPSPPRPPSSVCKRAQSARSEIRNPSTRPRPCSAPPEETDRMFRRIGKPTISYKAALGKIAPSYESDARENKQKEKPRPKDQAKSIVRLRRPTTAYKYKCGEGNRNDPDIVKYQEYDFSDDKVAPPRQVEEIIDRIRAPTIASEGGVGPICPKRKDSIGRTARMSKPLPLISGLPRSQNVNEIVERLSQRTPAYIHNRCRPISAFESGARTAHVHRSKRARSAQPRMYHIRVPLSTNEIEMQENPSPKILDSDSEVSSRSRSPRDNSPSSRSPRDNSSSSHSPRETSSRSPSARDNSSNPPSSRDNLSGSQSPQDNNDQQEGIRHD